TPGDSVDCVSPWRHPEGFPQLGGFAWTTNVFDMVSIFPAAAREIQVSFRTVDGQYFGFQPPTPLRPAPGPYLDRARMGSRPFQGAVLSEGGDSRTQHHACPPCFENSFPCGEHIWPDCSKRFGT